MKVYKLMHILYRWKGEVVLSPKCLGFYRSLENAQDAISHYNTCPGFCDNKDGYSITCHDIIGGGLDGTFYEVTVYFHDPDYDTEYTESLGLFGDYDKAESVLAEYCDNNKLFFQIDKMYAEKIIDKYIIEQKCWEEGFNIAQTNE